jgi:DNA mismatch repair ATPase MutS
MSDLFLDRETREKIEWDRFLACIEVCSPLGLYYKNRLKPFFAGQEKRLREELRRSCKFADFISKNPRWVSDFASNIQEAKDLRLSFKRAREGMVLSVTELFEIKRLLLILDNMKGLLKSKGFSSLAKFRPKGAPGLFRALSKGNQSPQTFYLVDDYSPLLKRLRSEKFELKLLMEKEKERLLEELKGLGIKHGRDGEVVVSKGTPDAFRFSADSRFYLKRETLQTQVYAFRHSPRFLKWESRVKEIEREEEKEERAICQKLSQKVSKFADALERDSEKVAYLDFLFAKSKVAIEYSGTLPQPASTNRKTALTMVDGIHFPLSQRLKEKGLKFQPLSIQLKQGAALLTGANMSGKTVLLKTIGLNICIAQHGMLVPAKSFRWRPLDFVFFSTRGKEQDGLSAFGMEIAGLKRALSVKEKKGLFLVDELARGTNPKEGFAINAAILTYLSNSDSLSLFTSHFDGLAKACRATHWQMAGLGNISLDQVKLLAKGAGEDLMPKLMDYRLEKVKREKAIPHDALKVALLLGLEEHVIELAETFLKKVQDEA